MLQKLLSTTTKREAIRIALTIVSDVPRDVYTLSIAVLDPGGNVPALRFSVQNYFHGGRHPLGWCGVEKVPAQTKLDNVVIDGPLFG